MRIGRPWPRPRVIRALTGAADMHPLTGTAGMHPKLAPTHLPQAAGDAHWFRASKAHLNAVFKPGAFGGQLMAQSLHAALASAEATRPGSPWSVSSQMSSFLGPVLCDSDVLYRATTVRESGKTFVMKRVQAFQHDSLPSSAPIDVERAPLLFDTHVALYRAAGQPRADACLCPAEVPKKLLGAQDTGRATEDVRQASLSLDEIAARIEDGQIKRGALFQTAMRLAQKMSLDDLHLHIRFPREDDDTPEPDKSAFYVGIEPTLMRGLGASSNLARLLLPYCSDGMTQVLAFSHPLDSLWDAWPRQISVWNYAMWFSQSAPPSVGPPGEIKWLFVEYHMQGLDRDLGLGHVRLYDWPSKTLTASSTFHSICRK